jgi:hypothetical protein
MNAADYVRPSCRLRAYPLLRQRELANQARYAQAQPRSLAEYKRPLRCLPHFRLSGQRGVGKPGRYAQGQTAFDGAIDWQSLFAALGEIRTAGFSSTPSLSGGVPPDDAQDFAKPSNPSLADQYPRQRELLTRRCSVGMALKQSGDTQTACSF